MEKTYLLFKKFIPVIFGLSFVSLAFGLFSLVYYYNAYTISVEFKNVIPIFAVIFFGLAVLVSILFSARVGNLHINRLKKNSGLSKFATLLAVTLATALFLYEFIKFVITPSSIPTFKLLRLIVFIPLIVYLVLNVIPKKINRRRVNIPSWIKPICSICTLVWCIFSLLAFYFWSGDALPITNMFRLLHIAYYVLAVLFFLAEINFELFGKGHKMYVLTSCLLFIEVFVSTGSVLIATFLGKVPGIKISAFEYFLSFALAIYAFSKLIAMQQTIRFVMKKSGSSMNGGSHHSHRSSKKKAKAVPTAADIPADIDI